MGHYKETCRKRRWKSALSLKDIDGLTLEGFSGRQARSMTETEAPAVALDGVRDGQSSAIQDSGGILPRKKI